MCSVWRVRAWGAAVSGRADQWIRWTTTGCVALLALIAATVSYLHMHVLVESHGQPGWVAALTPFSVDGMIVAASTTLLGADQWIRWTTTGCVALLALIAATVSYLHMHPVV